MYRRLTSWPTPERGKQAVLDIIALAASEGLVGHDSEFIPETKEGRIFGVASRERCAACYWDNECAQALIDSKTRISAYSLLGADKPVLEHMLGIKTPLNLWSDPMMRWYIVNPDLASVPKSSFAEESDDPDSSLGFMNLWACTSMLHDIPQWKRCCGPGCIESGRPCPNHNEMDYCSIDAWAGLVDDYALMVLML